MAKKSELKVEERVEAVLALLRREEPAAVLARRYQVTEVTLNRGGTCFWRAARRGWVNPRALRSQRRRAGSNSSKPSWRNGRRSSASKVNIDAIPTRTGQGSIYWKKRDHVWERYELVYLIRTGSASSA